MPPFPGTSLVIRAKQFAKRLFIRPRQIACAFGPGPEAAQIETGKYKTGEQRHRPGKIKQQVGSRPARLKQGKLSVTIFDVIEDFVIAHVKQKEFANPQPEITSEASGGFVDRFILADQAADT